MSTSNAGSAGFKNIRAMFENKANDKSQSPPSRGRSPNEPRSPSKERPLSKVRANFVTVEQPAEESQPPPAAAIPVQSTMDGSSDGAAADDKGLGNILKGSPFVDEGGFRAEERPRTESESVADRAAMMVNKMKEGNTQLPPVGDYVEPGTKPMMTPIGPAYPKSTPQATATSPPPNDTDSATISKGPVVKPRGGGPKILGVLESARQARAAGQVPSTEEKSAENVKSESSTKPTNGVKQEQTPAEPDPKPRSNTSKPTQISEHKHKTKEQRNVTTEPTPKPTSVTSSTAVKPARSSLPSRRPPIAATAPTASSVAKTEESKPSTSKLADKKPIKIPPRVANVTTTSSLAKKSSRASLNVNDGAKPKASARPADEGFLARMMRPTASSAQKAHEKIQPPSPPRAKTTSGKTITTRPSRRSLNSTSENKENEGDESHASDTQPRIEDVTQTVLPQQAEVAPSS